MLIKVPILASEIRLMLLLNPNVGQNAPFKRVKTLLLKVKPHLGCYSSASICVAGSNHSSFMVTSRMLSSLKSDMIYAVDHEKDFATLYYT